MRHTCAVFVLAFGSCLAAEEILLREGWTFESAAKAGVSGRVIATADYQPSGWRRVRVPSTVLAALVDAGVYPDPFYGLNLKKIPGYRDGRWLVMPAGSPFRSSWWYRVQFDLPGSFRGRNITLHLDGINYQANVWLNGRLIADAQKVRGMFRRFQFPVTGIVRPLANVLAVEVIAPGQGPDKQYDTKQIEATTGWDDHNPQPPDLNMGIWRDVRARATGPLSLHHPYVTTKLSLPAMDQAELTVITEVRNETDQEIHGEVRGEIESIRFAQPVTLKPGEKRWITFTPATHPQLRLKSPRVWWPYGMGSQELYRLRLNARSGIDDSDWAETGFGIREAATFTDEEGWRAYRINGRRVLIRGGAWMTSDMLLRLDGRRTEALVRYAAHAGLNMLRSEGFSIRETDEFYDTCDRMGVMVTQQIFGRSIPDEKLAIDCIEDTLLRIRNHPSLVHFLGHDETYPTPALDQAYRDLISKHQLNRTYQPHSGAFDVGERRQTGGTRTGTRELWTYATPAHYYLKKEDGAWGFAQSGGIGGVVSPYESMRRMMPKEDLWPPFTESWSFHTVIQGGQYFDEMVKALNRRYGPSKGIEEFCRKSQALNYESARGMFEAYGRNKYSATGITTWKYDAAWPASPTWQYVDWHLIAGGAYYGAKKACEPLHIQYSYDDRSVWVVNSHSSSFAGLRAAARVLDFDLKERFSRIVSIDVAADGKSRAFVVDWPTDMTRTFYVFLELTDTAGKLISTNRYWLSTAPDTPGTPTGRDQVFRANHKSLADFTALERLGKTTVAVSAEFQRHGVETAGNIRVRNTGKALAFLVNLGVLKGAGGEEASPAYWDDNYFSLLPGEERTLSVRLPAAELAGQTPVLRTEWWNQ